MLKELCKILDGRGASLKRTHGEREANNMLWEETEATSKGPETLGLLHKRFENMQDAIWHEDGHVPQKLEKLQDVVDKAHDAQEEVKSLQGRIVDVREELRKAFGWRRKGALTSGRHKRGRRRLRSGSRMHSCSRLSPLGKC